MKKIILLSAFLSLSSLMLSCASNPDNKAKSINVDSSNLNGKAPVEYGGDNPLDTSDQLPREDDTGKRANTIGDSEQR